MKITDWVFYRAFSFYNSYKEHDAVHDANMVLGVFLSFSIVFNIYVLSELLCGYDLGIWFILISCVILCTLAWLHYFKESNIIHFRRFYKLEDPKKRANRNILFFIFMILVVAFPLTIGYINFKMFPK